MSIASRQAASASARWGAETAITTLASPISTRPTRCVNGDRAQVVATLDLGCDLRHHLLGHPLVGLVLERDHVAPREWLRTVPGTSRSPPPVPPNLAHRRRRAITGSAVSRNAPPETGGISATSSPSAELDLGGAVGAIDRVEEPGRLLAQVERGPDVLDAGTLASSSSREPKPARSRRPAKKRTVTRTV